MSGSRRKKLTPRTARTFNQICQLKRDNVSTVNHWLMLDETSVSIAEQRNGQPVKSMVKVPRRTFHKFIDWYNSGVWPQSGK